MLGRTAARDDLELRVAEDTSLPGFLDGLSVGWAAMVQFIGLIVVTAGFLLPFIWVVPVLWLARRWWRARKEAKLPPPPMHQGQTQPEAVPVAPLVNPDVAASSPSVERGQGTEAEG